MERPEIVKTRDFKEVGELGKVDLGEKLTCSNCEARYYDLNKNPALCPKCGTANERPKVFKAKKAETAAKPIKETPKPKKKLDDDEDDIEDIEDIEDDDADDIEDDLDDEDDDVDSVIGPIDASNDSDT